MKYPNFHPIPRRGFLADFGMGFTGLALGAMLNRDGIARAATTGWQPPDGKPHFAAKAKSVIWLFMVGGASHMESFDPKPALNKYGGQDRRDAVSRTSRTEPARQEEPARGRSSACTRSSRSSIRCRSASRSAARAASKSATGGRTCPSASTTSPSSARCGPPTTITAPSSSSTPAGTCSRAFPDDRLVGPLRARLAERRPAAVRRAGRARR